MDAKAALKNQYHAALAMLLCTIQRCPDDLWLGGSSGRPFWRVAYHTLFYTHFYLQVDEYHFVPWEHHIHDAPSLWDTDGLSDSSPPPFTRNQILEYWQICDAIVDDCVERLDLNDTHSGFSWYPIPKFEHQILTIRHINQHVGQLSERLMAVGIDTDWVGRV